MTAGHGFAGRPAGFRVVGEGHTDLAPAADDVVEARRQLTTAALVGSDQNEVRSRILDFIAAHPDCLHRSCLSGHLTGSSLVVDPDHDQTLLIHHRKLARLLQPGGHADGDGNLGGVAWREATEETGLQGLRLVTPAVDVDIHAIPARPGEPEHLHLDLRFLVLVGPDREPAPNRETLGAQWVGGDDQALEPGSELHRAVARALDVARIVTTP
jgi:8-oxo-dGTP pyrophosphatase MutT (NUDIX family)